MLHVLLVIFIGFKLWTICIENLCWLISLIITIGKLFRHHKLIPHPFFFFQFLYVNVYWPYDFLLLFLPSPHEEIKFEWDIYTIDTVFCLPSNCVPDPEKSKNIILSPRGHKYIYNGVAQLVRTSKCSKWPFQPKCPWSTPDLPKVKQGQNPHKTVFFIVLHQTRAP